MARSRNIKPGFYLNEELAACSLMARFIFPGLWMLADRSGRMEDRPLRIKAAILPYDDCNMNALLDELHAAGMIARYQHGDEKYIQVCAFEKHQSPHVKEAESTIPAQYFCSINEQKPDASLVQEQYKPDASLVQEQYKPDASLVQTPVQHPLIPDSLNLIPEVTPSSAEKPALDNGFEKLWAAYPKKIGKGAAETAFKKAKINGHLSEVLIALEAQKKTAQWTKDNRQYVPNPATWINQKRWLDEPEQPMQQSIERNPWDGAI